MGDCRFLLDTNALSSLIREPDGSVARRVAAVGPEELCTSIVVACELRFGALKKGSSRLSARVEAVLESLPVLPLEAGVDRHYAEIRAALEAAGRPVGSNDLLIAAHARSLGLTVVTANLREFEQVPGLDAVSWAPQRGDQ